jgi:hypothetical protein
MLAGTEDMMAPLAVPNQTKNIIFKKYYAVDCIIIDA